MNKRLLKVAAYLGSQGFFAEAAQLKKVAGSRSRVPMVYEDNEPLGPGTLADVIPFDPPISPELRLDRLLEAAKIVRKCKGKSLDEIMKDLGFSEQHPNYEAMRQRLKDLMENDFYNTYF